MCEKLDLAGAVTAQIILAAAIAVFIARLASRPKVEYGAGAVIIATALPLVFLLIKAPACSRDALYFIQIGAMLTYIAVLLLSDYIFKGDFRNTLWMVIPYVTLFFAGTGGMVGLAARAGGVWTVSAVILFLAAGILAFIQRSVTGL